MKVEKTSAQLFQHNSNFHRVGAKKFAVVSDTPLITNDGQIKLFVLFMSSCLVEKNTSVILAPFVALALKYCQAANLWHIANQREGQVSEEGKIFMAKGMMAKAYVAAIAKLTRHQSTPSHNLRQTRSRDETNQSDLGFSQFLCFLRQEKCDKFEGPLRNN